jgi:hypothetical protein
MLLDESCATFVEAPAAVAVAPTSVLTVRAPRAATAEGFLDLIVSLPSLSLLDLAGISALVCDY